MIGTSDGEQFNTPFEHAISASTMGPTAPEKLTGALKTDLGTGVANNSSLPPIPINPVPANDNFTPEIQQYLQKLQRPSGKPDLRLVPGGKYFDESQLDPNVHLGTQVAWDTSRFPMSINIEDRRGEALLPSQFPPAPPTDRFDGTKEFNQKKAPLPHIDPNVQNVLSQPHIAEAIANPKIDRTHDVPYVAGASAKPDDFTTHVDQHIPTTATISGKTFDPAIPLNIHEQVEREVMNNLIKKGMTNEKAYEIAHHEYAEPAEDAWYKSQGIDVKDVNHWWDQQNKVTEKEKSTDLKFPPNLYKKPYPHDEVEGIKHEHSNVSAEWATSTKVAMDDHLKYNPADALNPMAEPARLPAAPKGVGEFIEAPAVITNTGKVFKGKDNHTEAFQAAKDAGFKHGDIDKTTFGGFSTSSGRYVDRREALGLAIINGQFTGRTSDVLHDMLMSHQLNFHKPGK